MMIMMIIIMIITMIILILITLNTILMINIWPFIGAPDLPGPRLRRRTRGGQTTKTIHAYY